MGKGVRCTTKTLAIFKCTRCLIQFNQCVICDMRTLCWVSKGVRVQGPGVRLRLRLRVRVGVAPDSTHHLNLPPDGRPAACVDGEPD